MKKRVFLFVIDGLGVGASEDANLYGDTNSNTLKNVIEQTKVNLPTMYKLGLTNIDGLNLPTNKNNIGAYGKMREKSRGKDTTTGHFEMMGIVNTKGLPTYPNGFSKEIIDKLESAFGTKILANCVASGTQIINEFGDEHLKTGYPIVYTSADSVLQIACHVDVVPLEQLYKYCQLARAIMCKNDAVGRIIARPFAGNKGNYYRLNENRKDFALLPDKNNTMQRLIESNKDVIAVGKISDIFANQSISRDLPSHSNTDALRSVDDIKNDDFNGLAFINLVDTDMLYGHRNDFWGYANCLSDIDKYLGGFIKEMRTNDLLILVGDHGNDPTTQSTDHSREFTPLIVYGNAINNINLGVIDGFDAVGQLIEEYLIGSKISHIGEKLWKKQ